ncbi:MAG TPA: arsenate reductase (glutaredoxin) [Paenalcaligenes sp.]|nr:arsenate reductase (glutaredoxin) [Paenalcaligenes sp.]
MVKIYHNPRCSKSREVLALLRERDIEPTIIEYLKTPLNAQELRDLFHAANLTVRDAMRTKEKEYKELSLENESLSDDELLAAIEQHPRLMNRPFVVTEKGARLCRPTDLVLEIL